MSSPPVSTSAMSGFSDVDRSADAGRLMSYLDRTDGSLAAMKSYMATAAARAVGGGVVVDIGCGVGHDLARLAGAGSSPIGIDTSQLMLGEARRRGAQAPVAVADGAALPFRDRSVDGVRIERVLQHVEDPRAVVREVARVVRPGGLAAVFEPDHETFRIDTDSADPSVLALPQSGLRVRHPAIGGHLAGLLESHGFRIDDVVTESSRGYALEGVPIAADLFLAHAISLGRIAAEAAEAWLAEQRARTAAGTFRASWDKILVVATRRPERD